jgi:hypothetical protein
VLCCHLHNERDYIVATILNVPITTAVTAQVGTVYQVRSGPGSSDVPASLGVQGTATGTPGTSIQWWLQFSYDDALTWCDACSFTHTSANRAAGVAVSSPSGGLVPATANATDGAMLTGVVLAGVFSGLVRVKFTSVGTRTLGNLRVDTFGGYIEPATG